MNASERLQAARMAVLDGKHEEALKEYVWFHSHALEERPSLYGVRLSFALSYWMELAAIYPDALRALERIRDEKTERLLRGDGDYDLFHDVESINESLEAVQRTYQLFLQLHASDPDLAKKCARLAIPALVWVGDFALAGQYLPEPEAKVRARATALNADIDELKVIPKSKAPRRKAYIHIYADEVRLVLAVLVGMGQDAEAVRIKELALKLVKSASVRKAVRSKLESEA